MYSKHSYFLWWIKCGLWKTEEEWTIVKGGIRRIEVSGNYDREIRLTFKCHLWIVSIMPTTYITITALKSTRTLWPSITNSKCHQADTKEGHKLMTDLLCTATAMVWFVGCSTSEGGQDWVRSCSLGYFPPPAPVHRFWGLLWGGVYLRLAHYTSVCETSSHLAF